jgi:phage protein D
LPLDSPLDSLRRPVLRVLANGTPILGAFAAEVKSNNHYAADRYSISVALNADPSISSAFWAATDNLLIEVQMALQTGLTSSWQSLVQGQVDLLDVDPIRGVLRLEGRDLTAAFIESRTQETFANRTSSEIAIALAERHGLGAQVTTTATPVGRYYQLEHDRTTLDQFSRATTEWDLLVFLAEQEGFDVFVQGTTLYFQPPMPSATPFVLQPVGSAIAPANIMDLRTERSLTLAADIEVTVKSWNSRQQTAFTQTARSGHGSSGAPPQRYVFVRPNLSMNEALQLAQAKLAELTRHERVITAIMPGELTLTPRDQVVLQGSGTAFDQVYQIDEIERRLSIEEGFVQRLRAKNASTTSEATTPADIVGAVTG